MQPEVVHSSKTPGNAHAANGGVGTMIWVAGLQGPLVPMPKGLTADLEPSQTLLYLWVLAR